MKIGKDTVVTMHYKVVNAQGQLLDKAQEPTSYLHGGYENTLPKIEAALEGQEVGFATTLNLVAADAFGERDETLVQTIAAMLQGQPATVPRFDKATDDRRGTEPIDGQWDVVLLEGWCIGARPQPAALLAEPINALEDAEDPHALWRTHINQALAGSYARAWAMLDALAFLAAPDWETVPRWRAQQEAGLARATGRTRRMRLGVTPSPAFDQGAPMA